MIVGPRGALSRRILWVEVIVDVFVHQSVAFGSVDYFGDRLCV